MTSKMNGIRNALFLLIVRSLVVTLHNVLASKNLPHVLWHEKQVFIHSFAIYVTRGNTLDPVATNNAT